MTLCVCVCGRGGGGGPFRKKEWSVACHFVDHNFVVPSVFERHDQKVCLESSAFCRWVFNLVHCPALSIDFIFALSKPVGR